MNNQIKNDFILKVQSRILEIRSWPEYIDPAEDDLLNNFEDKYIDFEGFCRYNTFEPYMTKQMKFTLYFDLKKKALEDLANKKGPFGNN